MTKMDKYEPTAELYKPTESLVLSVISKEGQLSQAVESFLAAIGKDDNIATCLQKVLESYNNITEIHRPIPQKCFNTFHKCMKYMNRHRKWSIKTSTSYKIGKLYFRFKKPFYGMKNHSKVIEDILKNPKKNIALDLEDYIRTMSKYGHATKAYEKVQALYQTNDAHDYNLALCLAELGRFHEALIYMTNQSKRTGMVSNELKLHRMITILRMKGDMAIAAQRAFDFMNLEDYNGDSIRNRLIKMSFEFKFAQCAFEAKYYARAYNILKGYTNDLLDACNDVELDVTQLKEALLRVPEVAILTKACIRIPEVKEREEYGTQREKKEHLRNSLEMLTGWQTNLSNAEFCIDKNLPMEGVLNILMHQCAVCHVLTPNVSIDDLLPLAHTEYIIALYFKLGWYDEVFKYLEFSDFYHYQPKRPNQPAKIMLHFKVMDFFYSIGYQHEATEVCQTILKLTKSEELRDEVQVRLSKIYYKQKSYEKCQALQKKYFRNLQAKYQYGWAICLACLNEWTSVLEMSQTFLHRELDHMSYTGFENMELTPVSIQHVHMLRGWCYKKMKSYSLATESFNRSIESSINPFTIYLQKIHTACLRGHHKAYKRFLIKIFEECQTLKKLLKRLSATLEEYPYFKHDWIEILNIISKYGRQLMPYPKTDIQGFKLYRSSSFMSMHLSKIRCSELDQCSDLGQCEIELD